MGFLSDSQKGAGDGGGGGKQCSLACGFKGLIRRKQVDSIHSKSSGTGHHQLAKELSVPHLIAIGKFTIFSFSLIGVFLFVWCFCSWGLVLWLILILLGSFQFPCSWFEFDLNCQFVFWFFSPLLGYLGLVCFCLWDTSCLSKSSHGPSCCVFV